MSTHNTCHNWGDSPEWEGFRDIDESRTSSKSRNLNYYLYLIEPYFDRLEVYSTEGDYRTPYPYQWIALSKVISGTDAEFDGKGGTPLEAVRDLYQNIKTIMQQEGMEV